MSLQKAHMQRYPFLNSFRLIAALGVFVQHFHEIMYLAGLPSLWNLAGVRNLGGVSVTAFFALSGFLITYLLAFEKQQQKGINFKRFYHNRILRIWPLYFFALILYKVLIPYMPLESVTLLLSSSEAFYGATNQAFTISPQIEWLLLLLILPHLLLALGKVFYPTHFWSIGVEETFYMIWPIGVEKTHNLRKFIVKVLFAYLLTYSTCLIVWVYLQSSGSGKVALIQAPALFLYSQRISCMAIGALIAEAILSDRVNLLRLLRHKATFSTAALLLTILLVRGFNMPILAHELYALLFSIVIVNIISWNLEGRFSQIFKLTERWGDTSYGIYMYHPFCIIVALDIVKANYTASDGAQVIIIQLFALLLTFFISHLSFHLFEQKIIKRFRRK